ncbi:MULTISPECIES: flavin reductase [unclassified Aeromicrobium]|uniref:flavin reductase n=1 Tax=unclassified Aeromicrobium TaxID=2633570 RepID=UPI0028897DBF|nr:MULTISPECIES: flavin reductase [unclassified Aeromicrobium]
MSDIDPTRFREVLGQYPTGVVVVTAKDSHGDAIGMTVGSFTSVSLDPPLVAFLPSSTSSSWKALRESGDSFCINVLGAGQEDLCRAVATRKSDKFAGFALRESPRGNPVIDGAVVWIDCITEKVHPGGDHEIVVGRVLDLDHGSPDQPLLFFRGGYGSFSPLSLASGDTDLLSHLAEIDLARPHMEALAERFETEVTAIVLVNDEMVLAAAAGRTDIAVAPTRVGQRLPFMPPIGSCFAAWGDAALRDSWIGSVADALDEQQLAELSKVPDLVRERGYAVALGHQVGAHLELVATQINAGDPEVPQSSMRDAFFAALDGYNQLDDPHDVELRSLSAPVFDSTGSVAYMLTMWGRWERVTASEVGERVKALCATAAAATQTIADR